MNEISPLDASTSSSIKHIENNYSPSIYDSSYRIQSAPTPEFAVFFKRNTLFDFFKQVMLLESILQVPPESLVAVIEERLIAQNWSMNDELVRVKDNWDGYVHPQGWPVVWIKTEFQELVTDTLMSILNEAATKLKLNTYQLHWLWQIIQPADPQYILHGLMPRPSDIKPLHVYNKQDWLRDLESIESMQIINARNQDNDLDWITVFEKQIMAHEEVYNVPYKQEISLEACLIPRQVYGGFHELDELDLWTEQIVPESGFPFTIQQMQIELISRGRKILDRNSNTIPLIAVHRNPPTFPGYWTVSTLASSIIDEFNLSFESTNLVRNGEVVAMYEAWREGYQNEVYTREKLSLGMRLKIRRDLLTAICNHYRKLLCIHITEGRDCYSAIYKREPEDSRNLSRGG